MTLEKQQQLTTYAETIKRNAGSVILTTDPEDAVKALGKKRCIIFPFENGGSQRQFYEALIALINELTFEP